MSKTKGQRVHEFTIRVTFDTPVKDFVALNEVRGHLKDADFYTENGCNAGKFIIKAVKKAPPLVIENHPAPQPNVVGSELLTTINEFARWHHLNEMTIAAGKTPSDSEIDFEATAWNRITRALAATEGSADV